MLRDLLGEKPVPGIATILDAKPDVLLLTNFDYDAEHVALAALKTRLASKGLTLNHLFALKPNTGMPTGVDVDGDGRRGGPRDAQGFGYYTGQGGQAILSRYPLVLLDTKTELLWRDTPDSLIAKDDPVGDEQRLSSTAHWAVSAALGSGPITLMTLAATPPVFDGPEDRNGRRNRDEVLLWAHELDAKPEVYKDPVVILGNFNLDPARGDGLRAAAKHVLGHPRLQDPLPNAPTVKWERVGEMRVSYVLPDRSLSVTDAGVMPPEPNAGPHRLVWVDLELH